MRGTAINYTREAWFARVSLAITIILFAHIGDFLAHRLYDTYLNDQMRPFREAILFTLAMGIIFYSNMLYHLCLIGHYVRSSMHRPTARAELESLYDAPAPALSVLIPSYKEEPRVAWQTMMSAALAEYPAKQVVLLIDDPHHPHNASDKALLEEARALPASIQQLFDGNAALYREEQTAFAARRAADGALDTAAELCRIAMHYDHVADWLTTVARDFAHGGAIENLPFAEKFFAEAILMEPANQHRIRARELRAQVVASDTVSPQQLARHYARLVGLFTVSMTSFERKKYANLSHEANKAMNLNSYIALIGKSWREVSTEEGLILEPCRPQEATLTIPAADYIDTIDADSLMLSEYVLRLIHMMEQPHNHRIAVAQSPCSAFPGSSNPVERVAGACIDVQFHTHQGYTHWDATFWVGANAMLRRAALEEIKETKIVGGKEVTIYIQDRTVIEDTESTIDLVSKGWKLYNYPERMTFSATPPDFGSLLIQRRRWANGGMIILPKLLGYAWRAKKDLRLLKELFMRVNYLALTTFGCAVTMLFFFYPFGQQIITQALIYSSIPLLLLYARDLKLTGYRYSDVLRVCALNLMLMPVILGGVLKQFQQMITARKIPFGRTPKVPGRTAAPALYCLLEVSLTVMFILMTVDYAANGRWHQFGFASLNAGLFVYALLNFIGLRAAFQDIAAGGRDLYQRLSAKTRLLLPAREPSIYVAG